MAYLLPDLEEGLEPPQLIAEFYDLFFNEILSAEWTDKKDWPKSRDLATFKSWFDCEFHSLVVDLVSDPLTRDG